MKIRQTAESLTPGYREHGQGRHTRRPFLLRKDRTKFSSHLTENTGSLYYKMPFS